MINPDTLKHLEFDKVLNEISVYAHSDVTRQQLRATVPLDDLDKIRFISGCVAEIRKLTSLGITLRLSGFDDIRPLLEILRPAGAFLAPEELLVFIPVLDCFRKIAGQLAPRLDLPRLKSVDPALKGFPEILEPLSASIDHDGSIKDSASTTLREIRRAKQTLAARIRKKLEEIVRDNNIEIFLQDDFITQRSGRWVIPVRMDSKGMVKGVVHDVSSSGETAFMEPLEIIPFVNELENLAAEEKAEEIRILRQLSAWIREDAAELGACFETLVLIDRFACLAAFADCYELEAPQLNDRGVVRLVGARHPLLLMLKRQGVLSKVEPLDLSLGDSGRVMVITGPNAGGKTIALKTTGILALMALSGIPVPADGAGSTFPLLDSLLVDIGDEQSIEQSLSTFSAHIARVVRILDQAGPRSLVLLDELGAGTEPQQGAAIACGVLHDLQERGAVVLATTHLSDIIGYVHRTPGMINSGMEYDTSTYTPLYRLIVGEPGHSRAIEIALRYGMPERVVDFAREMLGKAGEEFTSLLSELHRKREEMAAVIRGVEQQQEQLKRYETELELRAASIDSARREARDKAWSDARELISSSRRKMNQLLDEYKRERRMSSIESIKQVEAEVVQQLQPLDDAEMVPLRDVKVGAKVHLRSLGHDGEILQLLERQAKARVRVGRMEMDVALGELMEPGSKKERQTRQERPQKQAGWRIDAAENEARELNLIGLRVEEALDKLEPFLGQASLAGGGDLRVIHGLGSGRLRSAVREYLARHQLVDSYRSGDAHEGRDGVTVVTVRG